MIPLRSAIQIKGLPSQRWELFLDAGELFSETTPFRDYLEAIRAEFAKTAPATLELPEAQGYDDCVDGRLTWGSDVLDIYFERALSYLTISGGNEAVMRRALDVIAPLTAVS